MLRIKKLKIENCGRGMSIAADATMDVEDLSISGCGEGLELRDPISLRRRIGLPDDTPPEIIPEAVRVFSELGNQTNEEKESAMRKTKLGSWLFERGADIASYLGAFAAVLGIS